MKTIIELGFASVETKQTSPNSVHMDGQKYVEGGLRYRAADSEQNPDFIKVLDPA